MFYPPSQRLYKTRVDINDPPLIGFGCWVRCYDDLLRWEDEEPQKDVLPGGTHAQRRIVAIYRMHACAPQEEYHKYFILN